MTTGCIVKRYTDFCGTRLLELVEEDLREENDSGGLNQVLSRTSEEGFLVLVLGIC